MERIKKYGKQSEKLGDLQLELLDLEPAVSSDEIEAEVASGPLGEAEQNASSAAEQQQKSASRIRGATSYRRIWSGSKRSLPARPASAYAASAAPRRASSATKRPRCWA